MNINENEIDKLIEEAASQVKKTSEEILIEKKNNPDVEDDTSSRTNCVCGMIVSTKNLPRHTNSDRHKRLMQKLEEKTK